MVYYVSAAGQVMMQGPTGIMIPLGIELFLPLTTALMFYNYISLSIIFFVAAMSGSRSETRFCIVIPIIAGLLTWIGWLNAPDPTQAWAITIIAGLLGVAIYMNEMNHEKYGISGGGSKLLNIVFFLIIFQACIGLINGFDLFPIGQSQPSPDMCNVGYECDAYRNIDLSASVGQFTQSTGVLDDVVTTLTQLPVVIWQALVFLVKIAASVLLFSVVLNGTMNGIFPGIAANGYYVAFMVFMQIIIWAIYVMAVQSWIRGTGESTI